MTIPFSNDVARRVPVELSASEASGDVGTGEGYAKYELSADGDRAQQAAQNNQQ